MKVLVVSGFLGSGKTTFIKEMVNQTRQNFVVLENEYADVDIDGGLLKDSPLSVWELTEGCICCSMKADFATSILTISNSFSAEYLIVEPTGVGSLGAIMDNIGKVSYERIEILDPIALVDIHCLDEYTTTFDELYRDQIRNAGTILLSKIEDSSSDAIERAIQTLRGINDDSDIPTTHYTTQPLEWWNGLLNKAWIPGHLKTIENDEHPDLDQASYVGFSVKTMNEFLVKLQFLLRGTFGKIYRAKGYFPVEGEWARFDVVNDRYVIEQCDPFEESRMVVIGKDLNRKYLRKVFVENEKLF